MNDSMPVFVLYMNDVACVRPRTEFYDFRDLTATEPEPLHRTRTCLVRRKVTRRPTESEVHEEYDRVYREMRRTAWRLGMSLRMSLSMIDDAYKTAVRVCRQRNTRMVKTLVVKTVRPPLEPPDPDERRKARSLTIRDIFGARASKCDDGDDRSKRNSGRKPKRFTRESIRTAA